MRHIGNILDICSQGVGGDNLAIATQSQSQKAAATCRGLQTDVLKQSNRKRTNFLLSFQQGFRCPLCCWGFSFIFVEIAIFFFIKGLASLRQLDELCCFRLVKTFFFTISVAYGHSFLFPFFCFVNGICSFCCLFCPVHKSACQQCCRLFLVVPACWQWTSLHAI